MTAICLLSVDIGQGQQIKTGEQCPEFKTGSTLQYNDTLHLSDFRNKLLILDFWNTTCISCIKAFPKLDSIQKLFGNRVQLVLVNRESKDSTLAFFKKHKQLKPPSLPMITAADNLWFLFSENRTPYSVWIDAAGMVQYITESYNITTAHVQSLLAGIKPAMKNLNETWLNTQHVIYTSSITPCKENTNTGLSEGTVVKEEMIHLLNPCTSVADLFRQAYSEYNRVHFSTPAQIIIEAEDTFPLIYPSAEDDIDRWKTLYRYTYELKLPAAKQQLRYKIMQQDLARYFDIEATVEKRKLETYVLIRMGTPRLRVSKQEKPLNQLVGKKYTGDSLRCIINSPFSKFSETLKGMIETNLQKTFIDRAGISTEVDICMRGISVEPLNISKLNEDLEKYNLKIISSKELVNVLVLKQKRE